jgi:hypothetical protein
MNIEPKQNGWSANPTDRIDGSTYLLFMVETNGNEPDCERLLIGTWSKEYHDWLPTKEAATVISLNSTIHVICWLWIPSMPDAARAKASQIMKGLPKQHLQSGRNDNPEDHQDGDDNEWDFIDPEED